MIPEMLPESATRKGDGPFTVAGGRVNSPMHTHRAVKLAFFLILSCVFFVLFLDLSPTLFDLTVHTTWHAFV